MKNTKIRKKIILAGILAVSFSFAIAGSANAVLSVSCIASPTSADVGNPVIFSSHVSGGTGVYNYNWSMACSGDSSSCQNSFSSSGTYTTNLIVTSGEESQVASCAVFVNELCASHSYKDCHDDDVYWYDSCGNRQELFQTCQSGCASAQCSIPQLSVTASSSPNPATTVQTVTFTATPTGGTGYYTYNWTGGCTGTSQTCQKIFSTVGNYTANISITSGTQTQTASAQVVVNSACVAHSDKQCVGSNVYWFNSCGVQDDLYQTCSSNQVCQSGACVTIACNSNSDCGTSGYIDGVFCQNGNVYQNYKTYTCNNSGTASSSCSNSTQSQLVQTCSSGQTCANGSCGSNCAYHSYQQCSGNYLYWYNSCGVQQDLAQYCQNGCSNNSCSNSNNNYITVQTNSATNAYNSQATLNGYLYTSSNSYSCNNYVWFQYGLTTSYGSETTHQAQNYTGNFSQIINLYNSYNSYNNTYHFRAAAQDCLGNTVYGQDATTYSPGTGGALTVNKTVRNLSNGSGFASSTNATPGDVLMFMISLQANSGQNVQNVLVRDYFPANLIYKDQLVVSGSNSNYSGDITSGINLNTISAGQTVTITYQAQVAGAGNFSYGTTTLSNNVSVTSSNSSNPTSNASVIVTRSAVYGASAVSTGLTNNFWVDSFFLPLLVTLIGLWLWKSGMLFGIEKWLGNKKKTKQTYSSEKELANRIAMIQKTERV